MAALPISPYNSSTILGSARVGADTLNLTSYELCALFLCALWECARSGVVDGFTRLQHLRLHTNRKFDNPHRAPQKVAEFLEQERVFHLRESTSCFLVEG